MRPSALPDAAVGGGDLGRREIAPPADGGAYADVGGAGVFTGGAATVDGEGPGPRTIGLGEGSGAGTGMGMGMGDADAALPAPAFIGAEVKSERTNALCPLFRTT